MKTKLFRKIVETWRATSLLLAAPYCLVRAGLKPAPYRRTAVRLYHCLLALLLLLATAPAFAQLQVSAGQGFMLTSKADAASISGGVTYTWQVSVNNGTPEPIPGSNTPSLTVANGKEAGIYAYVRMVASDACKDGLPSNTYTVVVGTPVLQGSCTFTQPPVVSTFAGFPADYSASTFVSLVDERDGKIYTAVKIGNRWWMAQNLNYQEGLTFWNHNTGSATGQGFWCPDIDLTSDKSICDYWGALYAWETAMMLDGKGTWTEASGTYCTGAASTTECKTNHGRSASSGTATGGRGICPPNWHVSTDFEWGELLDAMESGSGTAHQSTDANATWTGADAGTRAKATCSGNSSDTNPSWASANGTDDYGFRVLPGDDRNINATADNTRDLRAIFWSSGAYSAENAWVRYIDNTRSDVYRGASPRLYGSSVRCARDD